ncbi:MAG: hypothetical protein P9L99_07035 [Candidatus Lernaella stagnicola]|nr:hypothetical protein [Candidatus Lernaella stagnicola]
MAYNRPQHMNTEHTEQDRRSDEAAGRIAAALEKRRRTIFLAVTALLALVAGALLLVRNTLPYTNNALLLRGDGFSERNVFIAAAEWDRGPGIVSSGFLPMYRWHTNQSSEARDLFFKPFTYTHYPPLCELTYALLGRLGVQTVHGLRLFPILLAVLGLFAFAWALRMLYGELFAIVGVACLILHPLFWDGADGLHEFGFHVPQQALLWLGLAMIVRGRERLGAVIAFAAAFWQGTYAFEYQLLTLGVIAGFYFLHERRSAWPWFLLVAAAGPLAFVLHFAQNVWHFGSLTDALNDLFGAAAYRMANTGGKAGELPQMGYLTYLIEAYGRYRGYLGGAFALPVVAAAATLALWRKRPRGVLPWFACLVIGSLAWFLVMRQISYMQFRLMGRVLYFLMAMSMTVVTYAVLRGVAQTALAGKRPGVYLLALAVLAGWMWHGHVGYLRAYVGLEQELAYYQPAEAVADQTPNLWHVWNSPGMSCSLPGLAHGKRPPRYTCRTVKCAPDNAACRATQQHIRLAFAESTLLKGAYVKLTARKGPPPQLSLLQVDEETRTKQQLLAHADGPIKGGVYSLQFAYPVAARLFELEIERAEDAEFRIDYLVLN